MCAQVFLRPKGISMYMQHYGRCASREANATLKSVPISS